MTDLVPRAKGEVCQVSEVYTGLIVSAEEATTSLAAIFSLGTLVGFRSCGKPTGKTLTFDARSQWQPGTYRWTGDWI
jgi:hypothetical protein